MFVGRKLGKKQKEKKKRKRWGGGGEISNGSSERAHFKEWVVPVTVQDAVFRIEKKWQS